MNYLLKIELTGLDKTKLFKSEKTGKIYLDAVMIESKENSYGQSHMIVQQTTEEERKAGTKGAILGNAKELVKVEAVSAEIVPNDLSF